MERTRVEVGACRCPGAPHPADWVELSGSVPIMVGIGVLSAIRAAGDDEGRLEALMARTYVRYGLVDWSFVDSDGRRVFIDPSSAEWGETVDRLLPWDAGGQEVAEAADALYSEAVLRPLMSRTSRQSQGGPMDGSTSATPLHGPKRQKRSKPSSRRATAGTPSAVRDP